MGLGVGAEVVVVDRVIDFVWFVLCFASIGVFVIGLGTPVGFGDTGSEERTLWLSHRERTWADYLFAHLYVREVIFYRQRRRIYYN